MNDLLAELQRVIQTQTPSPDVVRSMQSLVEDFLKRDEVDMDMALRLTPLVQAMDRMLIKFATEQPSSWDEVRRVLEGLVAGQGAASATETVYTIEEMDLLLSFLQEAQEHLNTIDQLILNLEKEHHPHLLDDIFRPMHTIKGVASFLNLPHIQTLAHALEARLDHFRKLGVCPDEDCLQILLNGKDFLEVLLNDLATAAEGSPVRKGRAALRVPARNIDEVLNQITKVEVRPSTATRKVPASLTSARESTNLLSPDILAKFQGELSEGLDLIEKIVLQLESAAERKPLFDDIFRQVHTIKGNAGFIGLAEVEEQAARMEQILDDLRNGRIETSGEGPVNHLLAELDALRRTAHLLPAEESPGRRPDQTATGVEPNEFLGDTATVHPTTIRKEVRVDTDKLDKLFDLIGELIIAQSMVLDHPTVRNAPEHDFNRSVEYLRKITRELQTISMNLRMIPLEGLFNKMHRLVRDLTKKVKKSVQFKISGQETEMDRNVIEQISDPLIHLIRNAVDHGIEPPYERQQKGKAPEGTIHLSARYSGNEIVIELHDDGRGLQRQKILEKARAQKLISGDGSQLSDQEVWALIFEPGFSTATQVTEISGRGVGMDVVRRNIEKLRGRVTVQSSPDRGSTFTLHIPLTLAILDGITFRGGRMLCALPTSDVQEFQSFDASRLHHGTGGTVFYHLRDQTLPFLDLKAFYGQEVVHADHPVILVIRYQTKQLALLVDEVLGTQQIVMKSLPDRLKDVRAVGGCTVMGNGEVCLIIDTQLLFKEALGT